MKKIFFLLACLLLLATSCVTQKQTVSPVACPVYYNGNGEPAAFAVFRYTEEQ
jgi:hypothetical protein